MKQIDEFTPALRQALTSESPVMTDSDVEALTAAVTQHAQASLQLSRASEPQARREVGRGASQAGRSIRGWIVGATLALAASAITLVMWPTSDRERASQNYVTGYAETMEVQLPSGSSIRLAPRSRLQYRMTDDGATIVSLQGQAFFAVSNAASAPFQVQTGNVVTTVLGTEFDVQYYNANAPVMVGVVSGKVSSGPSGHHVVLTPGMRGQMTDSTAVAIPSDEGLVAGSWRNGQLVFRNTPVSDVLAAASRWSGYEFRLADSAMATQRVTTVLVVKTPSTTLQLLKSLLNVTMTFDENVVTLSPRRQAAAPAPRRTTPRDYPLALEIGK